MSSKQTTFTSVVPAYVLGRPRSAFEAVYQPNPGTAKATVTALPHGRQLANAA